MNYEKLQEQVQWLDKVGGRILDRVKVQKLMYKVLDGKGSFDYIENDLFPLGYSFGFYGEKKQFSFSVVNEELKNRLIFWSDRDEIREKIENVEAELEYFLEKNFFEENNDKYIDSVVLLLEKLKLLHNKEKEIEEKLW